jgi:hypothetical protein
MAHIANTKLLTMLPPKKKVKKPSKQILLSGFCSSSKCTKRSVVARSINDNKSNPIWIEMCEDHMHIGITLDASSKMPKLGHFIEKE